MVIAPEAKLWTIAKEAWPVLHARRPMHIRLPLTNIVEVELALGEEMRGFEPDRYPVLIKAGFTVIEEGDPSSITLTPSVKDKTVEAADPFMEYFLDRFESADVLNRLAA